MTPEEMERAIADKLKEIYNMCIDNGFLTDYLCMYITYDSRGQQLYFHNRFWGHHSHQPLNYRELLHR